MTTGETSAQVVVAGAGIAGIETALALKAFAGDAVRVTLVDPGRQFRIPATATGRAFGVGRTGERLLAEVAARAGATLTPGRVTAVDPRRHLLMLAGGRLLTYDALVVAIGAWALPSVPGALHFTGHDDVVAVRGMIDEIGAGAARGAETDLAIVVPDDCTWPLAAYELALMAHDHLLAGGAAHAVRISVVTAEQTPLAVFGPDASASVARMLGRAGVAVHAGSHVAAWSWGRLEIAGGDALAADRVIALPLQRGPALDGLPADSTASSGPPTMAASPAVRTSGRWATARRFPSSRAASPASRPTRWRPSSPAAWAPTSRRCPSPHPPGVDRGRRPRALPPVRPPWRGPGRRRPALVAGRQGRRALPQPVPRGLAQRRDPRPPGQPRAARALMTSAPRGRALRDDRPVRARVGPRAVARGAA